MRKYQVVFQPSGRKGEVLEGKTVLEASQELGVQIESICGGVRNCGKCKIQLLEGQASRFTDEEAKFITETERSQGYRLACATQIQEDVTVLVPEESQSEGQVVRKEVTERIFDLKPAVILYPVQLPPPSLQDPLGDVDRLKKALSEKYQLRDLRIDYPTLLKVSRVLREENWKVTVAVWMEREIIDIQPGEVDELYGLAVDIGTTTVAAYLCSLRSGKVIAAESMMNPQVAYGEDVMSRITYTMNHPEDGLEKLHQSIIDGLNDLIQKVTRRSNLSPDEILEMTVVGNTAMHHLFLKIDPRYLGISPFPPTIHESIDLKARELGLKVHPSANVHILPVEAGFVGADNVGVLIAEEPYRRDEIVLIIDVGTNGELLMGNREKLMAASCATGPALEGAHIKFGMRAAPGAIERIEIDPETFEVRFEVIGNSKAKGICGSGIIDAIAEMYRSGMIDKSGRFRNESRSPRLRVPDETPEFVIAWKDETFIGKEITITQKDVRNVQLAKAALYTGAKLMMHRLGIDKVDKVILAGAFGSTIDPEKAMVLGMFPDCDLKNVSAVGNAAGDGARIALLNRDKRAEAARVAREVEYLELTIEPHFQEEFMEAIHLPHAKDSFPHLKGIVRDEILSP
ncbi:MAG: ASKHA domain-containing protein [Thermodesulfobacteriota bacterium]